MKRTIYPGNGRHNKAAVILASMSPDMVEDIISLVNARGRGILGDIFEAQGTAANSTNVRFLAVFSNSFIAEEDFEDTYLGFATVALSALRKPNYGNDEYQQILSQAYGLPWEIADPLAKKIETYDVLGGADKNQSYWTRFTDMLGEGVRRSVNWAANVLQLPWENDQDQKYDIDFLYEMKLLGQVVADLNSRARLMTAQAAINTNMGVLQTGDPMIGDQESADMMVGDTFKMARLRQLPKAVFGTASPIARMGHAATAAKAKNVLSQAGYHVSKGKLTNTQPKHPAMKHAVDKILNMRPSSALLAGGLLGATPVAIKLIADLAKMRKQGQMGDVDGDAYSTISTAFGDTVADAWLTGDIESVFKHIGDEANEDISTGDPELDAAIEASVMQELAGDIDEMSPEVGGLFTRWRINAAKKQASRRMRRQYKKAGRQFRKNREMAELTSARNMRRNSYMDMPQMERFQGDQGGGEDNYVPSDEMMSDEGADMGGDMNTLPFPENE